MSRVVQTCSGLDTFRSFTLDAGNLSVYSSDTLMKEIAVLTSKIAFQLGDASLSAEGTEAFVREAVTLWENLLSQKTKASTPTAPASSTTIPSAGNNPKPLQNGTPTNSIYENVFDSVDGKLKIIATVPGKNKAEQTRNVALVLLYGHYMQGLEQIPSELIRQACVDQGCFDGTNFAQYLKGLKSRVVMNTKNGGGYDVKLTAPGRKDAKDIVESLNAIGS